MTALEFQGLWKNMRPTKACLRGGHWAQVVKRPSPRTHTQQSLWAPRILASSFSGSLEKTIPVRNLSESGGAVPHSYLPCLAQSSSPQEFCPGVVTSDLLETGDLKF